MGSVGVVLTDVLARSDVKTFLDVSIPEDAHEQQIADMQRQATSHVRRFLNGLDIVATNENVPEVAKLFRAIDATAPAPQEAYLYPEWRRRAYTDAVAIIRGLTD